MKRTLLLCTLLSLASSLRAETYDVILHHGLVFDGSGEPGRIADIGLRGDRIAAIGDLKSDEAARYVNATGLAVAPGFVNMLSWATDSLLVDGRAQSDLRQGVTLEVFGEGSSMGPLNDTMKKVTVEQQGDLHFDVTWTTLGEYLETLEKRGIAPNVASFIGATTVRVHELGYADRKPTAAELERMKGLVRDAMAEGALGVGSSLIYAPAFYAKTDELVALAGEACKSGGMYISHMRSEGNRLLEAVDELLEIAKRGSCRAEIYHLKAAGRANWPKMDQVIAKVEAARASGMAITADMYTYLAGATGLDAAMPPWVQEGGLEAWRKRLQDPKTRAKVEKEMKAPTDEWENLLIAAGPENVLLVGFKSEALKPLTGKTLAEVAKARGKSPEQTAMDLVVEDDSRVGTIYFLMSEDNVKRQVALRWVSFGSDEAAPTSEGVFLLSNSHPRAYGNVARLLGHYVRDEGVLSLSEAVRKLSAVPCENLRLRDRGRIKEGYFADLVVFDPRTIADHATYAEPHQYATGVRDVFVNGVQVLENGSPTGKPAGRVVRGPGWTGWKTAEPAAKN